MTATVIPLDRALPRYQRDWQAAKIREAVDALKAEGQWPKNLSREQARARVETWLIGPGKYPPIAGDHPKIGPLLDALAARLDAPIEIVRNGAGRIVGWRRGTEAPP